MPRNSQSRRARSRGPPRWPSAGRRSPQGCRTGPPRCSSSAGRSVDLDLHHVARLDRPGVGRVADRRSAMNWPQRHGAGAAGAGAEGRGWRSGWATPPPRRTGTRRRPRRLLRLLVLAYKRTRSSVMSPTGNFANTPITCDAGESSSCSRQGFEAAVGGGADGSGAFAEDVSCGGGVEAEDGAEQDGFGLVRGGWRSGRWRCGWRRRPGRSGRCRRRRAGRRGPRRAARGRGAAGGAAQVVQGAVPGDGGDPAAEPVVGAGEAGQVAGDLEPGF